MAKKPTNAELQDQINDLERKARAFVRIQRQLQATEAKYEAMLEFSPYPVFIRDKKGNVVEANRLFSETPPFSEWETGRFFDPLPTDQAARIGEHDRLTIAEGFQEYSETFTDAEGDAYWVRMLQFPVRVSIRRTFIGCIAVQHVRQMDERAMLAGGPADISDISPSEAQGLLAEETERAKALEKALAEAREALKERDEDIQEVNTALQVLLKKRDEDRRKFEERVLFNVKEMVIPYLERMQERGLDDLQQTFAEILLQNLKDIISPFSPKLASRYYGLTNMELKVANLVRQGKSNKEIAKLFKLSKRTVESHRDSIRKKIGINKKKKNLRTYLLSMN